MIITYVAVRTAIRTRDEEKNCVVDMSTVGIVIISFLTIRNLDVAIKLLLESSGVHDAVDDLVP